MNRNLKQFRICFPRHPLPRPRLPRPAPCCPWCRRAGWCPTPPPPSRCQTLIGWEGSPANLISKISSGLPRHTPTISICQQIKMRGWSGLVASQCSIRVPPGLPPSSPRPSSRPAALARHSLPANSQLKPVFREPTLPAGGSAPSPSRAAGTRTSSPPRRSRTPRPRCGTPRRRPASRPRRCPAPPPWPRGRSCSTKPGPRRTA